MIFPVLWLLIDMLDTSVAAFWFEFQNYITVFLALITLFVLIRFHLFAIRNKISVTIQLKIHTFTWILGMSSTLGHFGPVALNVFWPG